MKSLIWSDLLRVPWEEDGDDPTKGLDCFGQAREIVRRAGRLLPAVDWRSLYRSQDVLPAALALEALEPLGPDWRAATAPGDLLASDPMGLGIVTHLATLVDPARNWVLTCYAPRGQGQGGGAVGMAAHAVRGLVGVYRAPLAEEPAQGSTGRLAP